MLAKVLTAALAASVLIVGASALPSRRSLSPTAAGRATPRSQAEAALQDPRHEDHLPRGDGGSAFRLQRRTHTRDAYYCRRNGTLCYYRTPTGGFTKKSCTAAESWRPRSARLGPDLDAGDVGEGRVATAPTDASANPSASDGHQQRDDAQATSFRHRRARRRRGHRRRARPGSVRRADQPAPPGEGGPAVRLGLGGQPAGHRPGSRMTTMMHGAVTRVDAPVAPTLAGRYGLTQIA